MTFNYLPQVYSNVVQQCGINFSWTEYGIFLCSFVKYRWMLGCGDGIYDPSNLLHFTR